MRTKDFILLGAGYAAGRLSKKMNAGPIGAVKGRYFVEFLNAKKRFTPDKKYFKSYEAAQKWAFNNFDKFSPDMIKTV